MTSHLTFFLTAFVCFNISAFAAGGPSAKEAVRTLGRERGSDLLGRIVLITGSKGVDQPQVWRIVTTEGGGKYSEYFLQNGKVVSSGKVPANAVAGLGTQTISMKKWSQDSTTTFMATDKAAKKSKVGFDYANYFLRCAEFSDRPVWTLTLFTEKGLRTGEVTIGGDDGSVLKRSMVVPDGNARGEAVAVQTEPSKAEQTVTAVKTGVTTAGRKVKGWVTNLVRRDEPVPSAQAPQPQPKPQPASAAPGQTYYYRPGQNR